MVSYRCCLAFVDALLFKSSIISLFPSSIFLLQRAISSCTSWYLAITWLFCSSIDFNWPSNSSFSFWNASFWTARSFRSRSMDASLALKCSSLCLAPWICSFRTLTCPSSFPFLTATFPSSSRSKDRLSSAFCMSCSIRAYSALMPV